MVGQFRWALYGGLATFFTIENDRLTFGFLRQITETVKVRRLFVGRVRTGETVPGAVGGL
jgi:hypothetical protein